MSNRPRANDFPKLADYTRALHRFCEVCGQPMEEVTRSGGYDVFTGAALQTVWLKCSVGGFDHEPLSLETIQANP